jgi:hypothetical protein
MKLALRECYDIDSFGLTCITFHYFDVFEPDFFLLSCYILNLTFFCKRNQ